MHAQPRSPPGGACGRARARVGGARVEQQRVRDAARQLAGHAHGVARGRAGRAARHVAPERRHQAHQAAEGRGDALAAAAVAACASCLLCY